MKAIYSILFVTILCLCNGCSNTKINQNHLEFRNDNQVITIEILDENKSLKFNESTEVKLNLKNIDKKSLTVSGNGVGYSNSQDDNVLLLIITPPKSSIKKKSFELIVIYRLDEKFISHKFLLPVM